MTRLTLVKVLDAFRQYVEETDARLEKLEKEQSEKDLALAKAIDELSWSIRRSR